MPRQMDRPSLTPPVSEDRDHVLGPPDAPVTLVEYGDFECPFCGRAHYEIQSVLDQLGDHVQFVFRHFPLTQIHPHAMSAAEAAEAAEADQGKFWPMHDMLYEHQDALDDESLLEYAQALDLEMDRFVRDLRTHRHADRIREDFMSGVRSGVNGTPTFFINGRRHNGPWDADSLVAAIEPEIAVAQGGGRGRRYR
jgi:protein-disulfide isomerase